MGLDGFSMSNLGMYNRLTSAQMSNEVDTMVARTGEQINEVDALGRHAGIARKDVDYKDAGGQTYMNDNSASDEELKEGEKDIPQPDLDMDEEDPEHSPKRFEIRIDDTTNTVELYDNYYQMTVQRITTQELLSMLRTHNDVSGVLLNRRL